MTYQSLAIVSVEQTSDSTTNPRGLDQLRIRLTDPLLARDKRLTTARTARQFRP